MSDTLGTTGLPVSAIGLGLAALGRPGYITIGHGSDLGIDRSRETMERNAHAVLDEAYALGVRYVDAARSYGLAEAFLASWLSRRGLTLGAITVGSKWGYTYTAEWRVNAQTHEIKDHSAATFQRQLGESRAILGSHLALYQVHSATLESGVLDEPRVIDAMAAARRDGLRIGLSVSGHRQAETIWRALDVRRDGQRIFDAVQATWNVLERAAQAALAAAHDAGLGVIVKEALANGRLAATGLRTLKSSSADAMRADAESLAVTTDVLAIAYALAQPWADVVLSGATTVPQVRSNLGAKSVAIPPSVAERLDGLVIDSRVYWQERAQLPWN